MGEQCRIQFSDVALTLAQENAMTKTKTIPCPLGHGGPATNTQGSAHLLSPEGRPEFATVFNVVRALGLKLRRQTHDGGR